MTDGVGGRGSAGSPLPSGRRRGALTIGARLRAELRDLGPRDLRRTDTVVAGAREARGGAAMRLGPRQLMDAPTGDAGAPYAGRDPMRTGRLWRWWHWLGFAYWATVVGLAGRDALRRERSDAANRAASAEAP